MDYDKQATEFLIENGLTFQTVLVGPSAPPWCKDDAGRLQYQIVLRRQPPFNPDTAGLTFPFWGSIRNRQERKRPTAYDVLACISSDSNVPETFEDYCDEQGLDTDSRQAMGSWKRCSMFAKQLRAFFTEQELTDLAEIQ